MSKAKNYSICKTRMQRPGGTPVGIAGQIFNSKNKKFVAYFTSILDGYMESMDVDVCDRASSFKSIHKHALKVADETAAEGAEVSTMCLEKIGWERMLEVVLADIDESFSLSEETRARMKEKARERFGAVLEKCLHAA